MTELKNIPSSQSKSNYSLIRLDRMYESLRYNEYSMESGLGEIVDNSVEAQAARIKIDITTEKSSLWPKSKAQRTDHPNCCCRRRIWYGAADALSKCLVWESLFGQKDRARGLDGFA